MCSSDLKHSLAHFSHSLLMAALLRPPLKSPLVPPLRSKPPLRALATETNSVDTVATVATVAVDATTVDTSPPAPTHLTTVFPTTSALTTPTTTTDLVTEEDSEDVTDT